MGKKILTFFFQFLILLFCYTFTCFFFLLFLLFSFHPSHAHTHSLSLSHMDSYTTLALDFTQNNLILSWETLSLKDMEAWSGLRPVTPDGLPIVSRTCIQGLWINAGHGTLGWTLSAGTARLLAEMMDGGSANPALDLERFHWRAFV